ncbi:GGDEF domain-containing protein [Roseateles violae]|uniref:diguanylate cyclase n=1 Tax=Roseateles violae TaxID=3058042 RepID=A0ABT8DQL8_9BURK|nr:GGDEF domain-containing protein [Pelomonas sp. PFR6]MDN3919350.1 GGDEF domain-containing protein [Pelomonas sp. PFR6]
MLTTTLLQQTDVPTLMLAITLMFFAAAQVWWALAVGARLTRRASHCLALGNALLGGSLAADALRGQMLPLLAFWGSDAMAITAFALLRAAVPAIADRPLAWRSAAAIAVPALLLLAAMPYGGDTRWHVRCVYLCLSLLVLLAAGDGWRQLRERTLRPAVAALLVSPLFAIAALLLTRLIESLLAPSNANRLSQASDFNIVWLWSAMLLCLLLNATMGLLVLMKLILRIQRLTRQDPLTDVLNHGALCAAIELEHARRQRGKPYALVMIDMDRFKQLNDTLGHAAGDAALLRLIEVLRPCVREIDRLGRLGGEEFCALLPLTDLAGAGVVAERMRASLEGCEFDWDGERWPLTASFGVAEARPDDASADAVLARADAAMYRAKELGRNRVQAQAERLALP